MKNKIFQSRGLCLRALDTNSACAKACAEMRGKDEFFKRRQQLFDQMEENAALILFSGIETHVSADEYAPFEANRNFFLSDGIAPGADDSCS